MNELLIHQLTLQHLAARLNLSLRDCQVLVLLYASSELTTPTINALLGIRKASMNRHVGPRLVTLGLLEVRPAQHARAGGEPTKRWRVTDLVKDTLADHMTAARRAAIIDLGEAYEREDDWVDVEAETEVPSVTPSEASEATMDVVATQSTGGAITRS